MSALAVVALMAAPTIASAANDLNDVSCTSASNCVAVGSAPTTLFGTATTKSLVRVWNGSTWSTQSTPWPTGAAWSELQGVTCKTASDCLAVGSWKGQSQAKNTLAMRWNGSTWAVQSTPNPAGATSSELTGVGCPSSTAKCVAVGRYTDSTGLERALGLVRVFSVWGVSSVPTLSESQQPPYTTDSRLEDVSCVTGPDRCMAVGSQDRDNGETLLAIDAQFDSTWALETDLTNRYFLGLSDVDCRPVAPSSLGCEAIGWATTFEDTWPFDPDGIEPFTATRGSTGWDEGPSAPMPAAADHYAWLEGLSCPSLATCVAVGGAEAEPVAMRLSGGAYVEDTFSASEGPPRAVSCTSSTDCVAVGNDTAYRFDGSEWDFIQP